MLNGATKPPGAIEDADLDREVEDTQVDASVTRVHKLLGVTAARAG